MLPAVMTIMKSSALVGYPLLPWFPPNHPFFFFLVLSPKKAANSSKKKGDRTYAVPLLMICPDFAHPPAHAWHRLNNAKLRSMRGDSVCV